MNNPVMADEIGQQLPATRNLHESLSRAEEFAARRKHSVVGLDHLMLALGQDPEAVALLMACKVDVEALCLDLLRKLGPEAKMISPNAVPPSLDITVQNLLSHASVTAMAANQNDIDGANIIATIISGEGSLITHKILEKHGLTFDAAMENLKKLNQAPPDQQPERTDDQPGQDPQSEINNQPPAVDKPAVRPEDVGVYPGPGVAPLSAKEPLANQPVQEKKGPDHQAGNPEFQANEPAPQGTKKVRFQPSPDHPQTEVKSRAINEQPQKAQDIAAGESQQEKYKDSIIQAEAHPSDYDLSPAPPGHKPRPPRPATPADPALKNAEVKHQGQPPAKTGPEDKPAQQFGQRGVQQNDDPALEARGRGLGPQNPALPQSLKGHDQKAKPINKQPPEHPPLQGKAGIMPPPLPDKGNHQPPTMDPVMEPKPMTPKGEKPPIGDYLTSLNGPPKKGQPENGQPQRGVAEKDAGQIQMRPPLMKGDERGHGRSMPPLDQNRSQLQKEPPVNLDRPGPDPHAPYPPGIRPNDYKNGLDQPPPPQRGQPYQHPDSITMEELGTTIKRTGQEFNQNPANDLVLENIPKVMRIGKIHYLEVRVARFANAELDFGPELYGLRAKDDKGPITKAITVRLTGPDGQFLIDSAAASTQWSEIHKGVVDDADFAVWRWRVLPRRAGTSKLRLDITVRSSSDEGLTAEIPVQPSRTYTVKVTRNYLSILRKALIIGTIFALGFGIARYGQDAYSNLLTKIETLTQLEDE